ncbi:jg16259 [Pararge aegeria aegeria]|uniref:Jg16259 protein n=1 Tax=Pararge aegeria aegeria TaxID=348720 RepID=A0A8S4RTS4_9NEOP|nr:jg16259 [Pararge aegeria aegeria]
MYVNDFSVCLVSIVVSRINNGSKGSYPGSCRSRTVFPESQKESNQPKPPLDQPRPRSPIARVVGSRWRSAPPRLA